MDQINEQKIKLFTVKAQADKAISSLKGILLGISLDGIVDEKEIIELRKWVIEHNNLIRKNPFNEFMTLIEHTISDKIPPRETIEDLYWLCQKYETDNYYYSAVTSDLQILQGLCHGILSDNILSEIEVFKLHEWLESNEHLNTYYPYDEIRSLVLSIVSDKKVDDEERLILKAYFSQFVDIKDKTTRQSIQQEISEIKISGLCTSNPEVVFPNKTFCITGLLQGKNREELRQEIAKLGGIPVDSVTRKTDYLIVGDNGNPAWAFSCYGRKVEKALSLRKEGHFIMLIHEFDLADIISDFRS